MWFLLTFPPSQKSEAARSHVCCGHILHTFKVEGRHFHGFLPSCALLTGRTPMMWPCCRPAKRAPGVPRWSSTSTSRSWRGTVGTRSSKVCVGRGVVCRCKLINSCALTWSLVWAPSKVLLQMTLQAHCVKLLPAGGRRSDSGWCELLGGDGLEAPLVPWCWARSLCLCGDCDGD